MDHDIKECNFRIMLKGKKKKKYIKSKSILHVFQQSYDHVDNSEAFNQISDDQIKYAFL